MLTEYDWENKFINDDNSVEVGELKRECSGGIKDALRWIVYKTLLLGFENGYSEKIEHTNVNNYECTFNAFQSTYLQSGAATTQKEDPFEILTSNFPEYFTSEEKDNYVFVSGNRDSRTITDNEDGDILTSDDEGKTLSDTHVSLYVKPLVTDIENHRDISEEMLKNIKQIKKDVPRIPTEFRKFQCRGYAIDVAPMYENILILYSEMTQSPYIQGEWCMMVPFIYNFITYDCKGEKDLKKVEANTFLCYTITQKGIRKDIENNYTSIISDTMALLKEKDPELHNRIADNEEMPPIDGLLVKWIGKAFIQTFKFYHFLRLFDFLISRDPRDIPQLLKFLSVATFVYHRKVLLEADACECMELLFSEKKYFTNGVRDKDIERIIRLARQYMDGDLQ